jgi:hypothetical protein
MSEVMISKERVMSIVSPEDVLPMLGKAIGDPTIELEFICGAFDENSRLTKPQFLRVLRTLREQYVLHSEDTTLDIRRQETKMEGSGSSPIRITIQGIEDIQRYCKTNDISSLSNVSYLEKTIYRDEKNPSLSFRYLHKDYDYRMNLKTEVPLERGNTEVEALVSDLSGALKYYRFKKRFSFLTNDR